MKIKAPFFILMAVWLIVLVINTIVGYVNLNSVGGTTDFLVSGFSRDGFAKVTLMGVKLSLDGIGVTPQFFIILIVFAALGLFLSNMKTQKAN